jgi:hypothetical protein
MNKIQFFCSTTQFRLTNSYRNTRAGSWRHYQSKRRRVPGIMYQNNWVLKYKREFLGHSPSVCYTRSFTDIQLRSHQIIPDLSVHRTFYDVFLRFQPTSVSEACNTNYFHTSIASVKRNADTNIQLQLITAVNMETTVFSYVTPCSVANFSKR